MVRAKGKFKHFDFPMASDFYLSQTELEHLKNSLSLTLKAECTEAFLSFFNRIIGLMRSKIIIDNNIAKPTESIAEIEALTTAIKRVEKLLSSNGISPHTRIALNSQVLSGEISSDENLLTNTYIALRLLEEVSQKSIESLKLAIKQNSLYSANDFKLLLIKDLAREYEAQFKEAPTKARNGTFEELVKLFLSSIKMKQPEIKVSIPQDLFPLISKAIDEYPHEEKNPAFYNEDFV